jgi:glycosyltransferase involved in cell wall biosynthesis
MSEKIKLFIFIHDLAPFGAQRVALYTVKNLSPEKFSVIVCPFGGDETLAPEFATAGAKVVPLKARRFLDIGAWYRVAKLLFVERPDIIQTNLPELSVPVRLIALFIPGLRVIHGVHNPFASEPWYWRSLNLLTAPFCAAIAFSSQGLMNYELKRRGPLHARLVAIPNGVEPATGTKGLREELGIGAGEKVVCCAARLTPQKGQDILIRAMAELVRKKNNVRLLLAGDGEDFESLKALSTELGLDGKVLFLGRRDDIGRLLAASDIYASASRWESFDIALGEAMLAGLPCVGTEIAGHEDILKDCETGIAVPPWSPVAMASAIELIIDRPETAAQMAAAAKELIRRDFSPEAMGKKYENLYLETTGRRS